MSTIVERTHHSPCIISRDIHPEQIAQAFLEKRAVKTIQAFFRGSNVLQIWAHKYCDHYAAHAVWEDNLPDLMQSGKVMPAEMQLAYKGFVQTKSCCLGERKIERFDFQELEKMKDKSEHSNQYSWVKLISLYFNHLSTKIVVDLNVDINKQYFCIVEPETRSKIQEKYTKEGPLSPLFICKLNPSEEKEMRMLAMKQADAEMAKKTVANMQEECTKIKTEIHKIYDTLAAKINTKYIEKNLPPPLRVNIDKQVYVTKGKGVEVEEYDDLAKKINELAKTDKEEEECTKLADKIKEYKKSVIKKNEFITLVKTHPSLSLNIDEQTRLEELKTRQEHINSTMRKHRRIVDSFNEIKKFSEIQHPIRENFILELIKTLNISEYVASILIDKHFVAQSIDKRIAQIHKRTDSTIMRPCNQPHHYQEAIRELDIQCPHLASSIHATYNDIMWHYGSIAILVGLLPAKDCVSNSFNKGSSVTFLPPWENEGKYFTISLSDSNVIIMGPKSILGTYRKQYKNIVTFEEMSPRQRSVFGVPPLSPMIEF